MKKEMRKPSYSEIYMYKNLFWFGVFVFIFCPILNNVALQLLFWYSNVDIAYSFLMPVLTVVQETISLFISYAGLALLCICTVYFGRNAKGVITLAFVSHAVIFLSYVLAIVIWDGGIYLSYILEAFLIALPDAVVMLCVYIALLIYAKTKSTFMNIDRYVFGRSMLLHTYTKSFFLAVSFFAAVKVVSEAAGMIVYYNNPRNYGSIPTEAMQVLTDIVMPYVFIILFAALGLVIMIFIGLMAQALKDSGKSKLTKVTK